MAKNEFFSLVFVVSDKYIYKMNQCLFKSILEATIILSSPNSDIYTWGKRGGEILPYRAYIGLCSPKGHVVFELFLFRSKIGVRVRVN